MLVVPDLTDDGAAGVGAVLTGSGVVISGTAAADVGNGAVLLGQLALDVGQGVLGLVGGHDVDLAQPVVGGETAVVLDGGLVELDDLLVLDVVGTVAGDVKGGIAGGVLGELVSPEVGVGRALVDPVGVHVVEQVVAAEVLDEIVHAGALVRRHHGTVGQAVGGVGRRHRVVLARQVAVLRVRAVAEIGPQAVQRPRVGWQELTLRLETRVRLPELRREHQSAERLGTACVRRRRVGGRRARQNFRL